MRQEPDEILSLVSEETEAQSGLPTQRGREGAELRVHTCHLCIIILFTLPTLSSSQTPESVIGETSRMEDRHCSVGLVSHYGCGVTSEEHIRNVPE